MLVNTWIAIGIVSTGKINPERMNDGSSDVTLAAWNATCWESATVEIKIPNPNAANRNVRVPNSSKNIFPLITIPNKI